MHADCGRGKGVGWGKEEGSPILAASVGSAGGAGEDVMPFKDVGFGGVGGYVGGWGGGYGGVLAG